jgi:hypothetical protein
MRNVGWFLLAGIALPVLAGEPRLPEDGMFHVYANNRSANVPNYITEDFLLLSYSMILRNAIADYETEQALPALRSVIRALVDRAAAAHGGEIEAANLDFLKVMQALLEGGSDAGSGAVAAELARIRAADKAGKSELLAQTIDYTQFRPRGHYTRTPELSRYFQAVRYGGAAAFYMQHSASTGIDEATADRLVRQAVILSKWISEDAGARRKLADYEQRRAWLFGPPEDLTNDDLLRVAAEAPEGHPAEWRKKLMDCARQSGRQPSVFSAAIDISRLERGVTAKDALTAWRLLPGSFTPDAAAAQQLVHSHVGKYLGSGNPVSVTTVGGMRVKGFPLGLEILSLLGSREAARRLAEAGEIRYEGYAGAKVEAARQIARPGGLPGEHLSLIASWVSGPSKYSSTHLESGLAFWTLYRHESALYTKQSYTTMGKGITLAEGRASAWLEPASELYLRLRRLSAMLETRLGLRQFTAFSAILDRCIQIADHERAGRSLTPEEAEFLNGIDLELLPLTGGPDLPVAVDIHTDLNSAQVMVEALRYPVVVTRPVGQRGPRFRVAEFKQPLADRITDERWREMLAKERRK